MPRETNIQIRRGTASDWASVNPTLASGEMAIENDTRRWKVGDGSTAWNELRYVGADGGDLDGNSGPSDPYFESVSLLLSFDNNLTDSSGYAFQMQNTGTGTSYDSENPKFGTHSISRDTAFISPSQFDGITNQQLSANINAALRIGSGAFTIEFWIYAVSNPSQGQMIMQSFDWENRDLVQWANYGYERRLMFYHPGGILEYGANQPIPLGQWSHVAFVGYGVAGGIAMYVNGTRVAYTASAYDFQLRAIGNLSFAYAPSGTRFDEFRFTKGVARYSGESFAVPDAAFPTS